MANIDISGNFDGGNPKDPQSIVQTGPNDFTIIPYSEDNDPNYKFRLDVKIFNKATRTESIKLNIEWNDNQLNKFRNYVFFKNAECDWKYLPARLTGTESIIELDLPPGETYLCLHPKYNYQDYITFISSIPSDGRIEKRKIGRRFGQEVFETWCQSMVW